MEETRTVEYYEDQFTIAGDNLNAYWAMNWPSNLDRKQVIEQTMKLANKLLDTYPPLLAMEPMISEPYAWSKKNTEEQIAKLQKIYDELDQ